jgi:hypothetical protein
MLSSRRAGGGGEGKEAGDRGEEKAGEGELRRERCFRGSQAILKYACGTELCSRDSKQMKLANIKGPVL